MHNNDLTIKVCIEKILEIMHDLGYSKGNIEAYEHSYNTFLKFCSQNNYTYFREEIALEFLKQTYGLEFIKVKIRLPKLLQISGYTLH